MDQPSSKRVKTSLLLAFLFLSFLSPASWYWPFGEATEEKDGPRLSELMEPAATNIDAAVDFAAEGNFKEAQRCYRAALASLKQIEDENPERAATPEFATVRNKRAYVNAALDTMLLAEARENAKAVAVTDTTGLERDVSIKPWREFQPTYTALTNVDRLVARRLEIVRGDWARQLLAGLSDARLRQACASNIAEISRCAADYERRKAALASAYRRADAAAMRLERVADSASERSAMRVFDICRTDLATAVSDCQKAWPPCGKALGVLSANLEGLHTGLLNAGAARDFPEIARIYADGVSGRRLSDASAMAEEMGPLRACEAMIQELNEAKSGVVHRGELYRLQLAWGGEEAEAPTEEEDRGLVKDESDNRPKVENQIDNYMAVERKRNEKVKRAAEGAKVRKGVRREIDKLIKEDPKSRKARLLMAGEDLREGDTAAAMEKVKALLDEKPGDCSALNMRAAIEAAEGDLKAAEKTLDQTIQSNPRDYHAYYNMANIYLQRGNRDGARRYYETGRSFAGPKNEELEKAVMIR